MAILTISVGAALLAAVLSVSWESVLMRVAEVRPTQVLDTHTDFAGRT